MFTSQSNAIFGNENRGVNPCVLISNGVNFLLHPKVLVCNQQLVVLKVILCPVGVVSNAFITFNSLKVKLLYFFCLF